MYKAYMHTEDILPTVREYNSNENQHSRPYSSVSNTVIWKHIKIFIIFVLKKSNNTYF